MTDNGNYPENKLVEEIPFKVCMYGHESKTKRKFCAMCYQPLKRVRY